MAGHSKWANIKHRKERSDKKRGKLFSRIMKEILSAVKQGGPDSKTNAKLRSAIQKGKDANIPNENIERNIKKASEQNTQDFTEMTYELYGFGGVGLIVDILSDNKNRIASDIRIATNKCGGTIAAPGAVSYNFARKGVLRIPLEKFSEEELFLLASEAGAEDFFKEDDTYLIITPLSNFASVNKAIRDAGGTFEEASISMVPKTWVEVDDETANANIALIEWLENLEDVDAVYHNMKIT